MNEEMNANNTPQVNNPQPQGKSKAWLIIIIILVVLIILGIGGYFLTRYFVNKAAGKIASSVTGGQVDINSGSTSFSMSDSSGTVTAGETTKWPSDMPSTVPQFKYGKIKMAVKSNTGGTNGWSVTYENVESDGLTKYKTDLTNAGWTVEETAEAGVVSLVTAKKDNLSLNAIYDPSSKGVSITVTTATS